MIIIIKTTIIIISLHQYNYDYERRQNVIIFSSRLCPTQCGAIPGQALRHYQVFKHHHHRRHHHHHHHHHVDKHSRAEKERKAREKADKGGERRASSHELRTGKEGGSRAETKEKDMVRIVGNAHWASWWSSLWSSLASSSTISWSS